MANHKSALKRARQNEIKRLRNMSYKTRSKNAIKEVRGHIVDKAEDKAMESLKKATSTIQKSASKGAIHRKNASRKISRLTRQINQISS